MILIGYQTSAEVCLKLYNSKRFSSCDYGVSQPCQLRYLKHIEKLVNGPKIKKKLPFYRLKKITYSGGLNEKYFVKISQTRDQSVALDNVDLE